MGLSEDSDVVVDFTTAHDQQQADELTLKSNKTTTSDLLTTSETSAADDAARQLESDAALAAAMSASCYEDDDDDLVFWSCQICFDVLLEHETVTQLCGDACTLQVCAECLVQHVTASVYSFYPGVLPKVRCPTCFTLLNKSVWATFVQSEPPQTEAAAPVTTGETEEAAATQDTANATDAASVDEADVDTHNTANESSADADARGEQEQSQEQSPAQTTSASAAAVVAPFKADFSHVLEKYEILCRQSCEFQSPCCHNPEYTMLPPFTAEADATLVEFLQTQACAELLPELLERCERFCFHREETKTFYAFLVATVPESALDDVLWRVLATIRDEERRATLLLYHLFLHPDTHTLCCDEVVCFKCKAQEHHDGACDDFLEDDCVLQCRGCHVTLVKVDGCDSVSCVCGHAIHWPSEMEKQRRQRKTLAPAGDSEYAQWLTWTQRFQRSLAKITSLAQSLREVRLERLIRGNRTALRKLLVRYQSAKAEAKRREQERELERAGQAEEVEEQATGTPQAERVVETSESEDSGGEMATISETAEANQEQQPEEDKEEEEEVGIVGTEPTETPLLFELKRLGVDGEVLEESSPLLAAAAAAS